MKRQLIVDPTTLELEPYFLEAGNEQSNNDR